jgi:two-component system LytT family response regulator/two-component system response regulator LytT
MLVDDEQLAQDELAYLLKEFPDIEIVGTARHGLEAVELIQKAEPDLVFMDVQMPGLDGLAVVRKLRELNVEMPHIIFPPPSTSTRWRPSARSDGLSAKAHRARQAGGDYRARAASDSRPAEIDVPEPSPRLSAQRTNCWFATPIATSLSMPRTWSTPPSEDG